MNEPKKFKGTPGEWVVEELNDGSGLHAIFSSKSNTLVGRTCYYPQSENNARLMSLAPKMLAAMQQSMDQGELPFGETYNEFKEIIKLALGE